MAIHSNAFNFEFEKENDPSLHCEKLRTENDQRPEHTHSVLNARSDIFSIYFLIGRLLLFSSHIEYTTYIYPHSHTLPYCFCLFRSFIRFENRFYPVENGFPSFLTLQWWILVNTSHIAWGALCSASDCKTPQENINKVEHHSCSLDSSIPFTPFIHLCYTRVYIYP